MKRSKRGVLSLARLGAKGQLTIPLEYRRTFDLSGDSTVVLVRVGDALVIVPHDEAFAQVTDRLEARMRDAGSSPEELIAAAADARVEIVREEFGIANEE
jgi:bifunctional DNA-binding transcriptional regulator/antitoxin component of YhaV-PrlF toxin-antitoxin module